jgi:hypothetical protein
MSSSLGCHYWLVSYARANPVNLRPNFQCSSLACRFIYYAVIDDMFTLDWFKQTSWSLGTSALSAPSTGGGWTPTSRIAPKESPSFLSASGPTRLFTSQAFIRRDYTTANSTLVNNILNITVNLFVNQSLMYICLSVCGFHPLAENLSNCFHYLYSYSDWLIDINMLKNELSHVDGHMPFSQVCGGATHGSHQWRQQFAYFSRFGLAVIQIYLQVIPELCCSLITTKKRIIRNNNTSWGDSVKKCLHKLTLHCIVLENGSNITMFSVKFQPRWFWDITSKEEKLEILLVS